MSLVPSADRKLQGFYFKQELDALGLRQDQFATLCGRSRGAVSNAITGHHSALRIPEWATSKLKELQEAKKDPKLWKKILAEL